jgi:hypothetical protein
MISQLFSRSIRAIAISTLACWVALLAGCQKKPDPAALQRIEKAVSSYQRIINSYGASGFTNEEFRVQSNEADFLLRDAIKYIEVKGIKTDFLTDQNLVAIADKLADLREIFNLANDHELRLKKGFQEIGWKFDSKFSTYDVSATHYLPDPECTEEDSGWILPGPVYGVLTQPFGPFVLLELAKKLPELILLTDSGVVIPEDIRKEILCYEPGKQEPKGFLTHFEKYCKESQYGFSYSKERDVVNGRFPHYHMRLKCRLSDVQSAAISEMRKLIDNLDVSIKKIQ